MHSVKMDRTGYLFCLLGRYFCLGEEELYALLMKALTFHLPAPPWLGSKVSVEFFFTLAEGHIDKGCMVRAWGKVFPLVI